MSIKNILATIVSVFLLGYLVTHAVTWTPASSDLSNVSSSTLRDYAEFNAGDNITISATGTISASGAGFTLNGLTEAEQIFATGSGPFSFVSDGSTHTLNLPTADTNTKGFLTDTDWDIFAAKLGSGALISLLNNDLSFATTGLVATKLSSSTNLTVANFATNSIGQWTNNNLYAVSSTVNAAIALKISTSTYNVPAQACGGSDKVSSISATGTIICTTDQSGGSATSTVNYPVVIDKIYTNQTAARNTWGNSAINYAMWNFTQKTTCRSIVQTTVAGASVNSKVQPQFSPDNQATWYQIDGSSATGATSTAVAAASIGVANVSSSAWVAISSTMKQSVYLRYSAWDGNGTADPAISAFIECF